MENNLQTIKKQMAGKMGMHVKFKARAGRRGFNVCSGILDGLYPEIFTVMVNEDGYCRRYCFCYSEILTHHVEIAEETNVPLAADL